MDPQIPTSFYAAVGVLVVMNFSSLMAVLMLMFKIGVFVSETKLGIKDAKDSSIRAHKRIDRHEEAHDL